MQDSDFIDEIEDKLNQFVVNSEQRFMQKGEV